METSIGQSLKGGKQSVTDALNVEKAFQLHTGEAV